MKIHHYLIVDTDSYAGNFERELSTFVINVADEYAHEATMQEWLGKQTPEEHKDAELFGGGEMEGIVEWDISDTDDIPLDSPQQIVSAPDKWDYNSVQFKIDTALWDQVTPEVLEKFKARAKRFCELYGIGFVGVRHMIRKEEFITENI